MAHWPKCAIFLAVALLATTVAHAGPPFRTDDPEPVDEQRWETNISAFGSHVPLDVSGDAPSADINYGAAHNLQLHVQPQGAFDAAVGARPHFGLGDTEAGFKYRFIDEDEKGATPMAAIYPLLELPTGNARLGLGEGFFRAFLPLWLEKNFGDWTAYGGGGYWINENRRFGDKNYVYTGWTAQRKLTSSLTLGCELFYQTAGGIQLPTNLASRDSLGFNLGGIYDFDDHNHLLFSAGRGLIVGAQFNLFSFYAGWRVTY